MHAANQIAIDAIIATLEHHLHKEHPRPTRDHPALRDAHPKHHGCVKARFVIEPNLPNELRQGLFEKPATYEAWIRFSNAFKIRHDLVRDARGMAIKLMGVPDATDADGSAGGSQDFLLVTHHSFFARDAADFVDFPAAVAGARTTMALFPRVFGFFFGFRPFRFKWSEFWALQRSLNWATSPLVRKYFSQTPYQFGRTPAKFKARPRQRARPDQWVVLWFMAFWYQFSWGDYFKFESWENSLQKALVKYLKDREAVFDFEVQLHDQGEPPDDAVEGWSTSKFPYRKVATIYIDQHDYEPTLNTMMQFGQHLSYTPWHNRPDHRPLGSINDARRSVYEAISQLRHGLNRVKRLEPQPGQSQPDYLRAIQPPGHPCPRQ
jgi:hypothetical protein